MATKTIKDITDIKQIMDSYAKYKPGEGEADIKYQKMAMAGNLTEKAFDADAAKEMALHSSWYLI